MSASLPAEFTSYELKVREYARTWFKTNPEAQAVIQRVPSIKARVIRLSGAGTIIGTDAIYQVAARWLPQRMTSHDAIVQTLIPSGSARRLDVEPLAILILGLPGSGKSTQLRCMAREFINRTYPSTHVVVDADDVRGRIPEYADGLGSEVVQVETAFLTYQRLVDQAYRHGSHLIFDMVGDPGHVIADVDYLISAGWAVLVLCGCVDVETAVARVVARAVIDGRYVPPSYVRSVGTRPTDAYWRLRSSNLPLVGAAMLDTAGPKASPPVVLDTDACALFGNIGEPTTLW